MKKVLRALYRWVVVIGRATPLRRSEKARQLANLALPWIKGNVAKVNGHVMYLDSGDCLSLSVWGVSERMETAIVQQKVRPGDHVIDIGANIGYYTLLFAKQVGPTGRVYAFEPDPTNFELLKKNVEINEYSNVALYQKAVSKSNCTVTLYLDLHRAGQHSTSDVAGSGKGIEVDAIQIDSFDELRDAPISFVKMDIEGSELPALEGMRHLLCSRSPDIMMEFYPKALRSAGTDPAQVLSFLEELDYSIENIDSARRRIVPVTPQSLLEQYPIDDKIRLTDLLCRKRPIQND